MKTRFLLVFTALGCMSFMLTACHTVRGLGEDIEATGGAMEEAADVEPHHHHHHYHCDPHHYKQPSTGVKPPEVKTGKKAIKKR